MEFGLRFLIGAIAATAVAVIAYRARSLTESGAAAAAVTGTAAVAAGFDWGALLIMYFVSSTILSRIGRRRKQQRTAGVVEKQGPRDAWQVLANGLPFLVAASAAAFGTWASEAWMAAAAGSLAASAADTWATEVGTLVGHTPRSILNGRPLGVGQSGGVTLAGSLASVGGAVFIASVVVMAGWGSRFVVPVMAAGIAGSLADSLIGATLQERRWCDACEKPSEMFIHTCGAVTRRIGGLSFLGNDGVNLIATIVGALTAVSLAWAWR